MSAYSEIDIFGRLEDLDPKNDDLFNKRFVISNIMKHECFGHIKFSINDSSFQLDIPVDLQISKYEPSSPIQTYSPFNGEFIQIYDPNSKIKKGESGYSFCYFITRGQKLLYNFLENTDTLADFSELYNNVELMTKQDLGEFCLKLKQLGLINNINLPFKSSRNLTRSNSAVEDFLFPSKNKQTKKNKIKIEIEEKEQLINSLIYEKESNSEEIEKNKKIESQEYVEYVMEKILQLKIL